MRNERLFKLLVLVLLCWSIILTLYVFQPSDNHLAYDVNEYHVSGFSTDLSEVVSSCRSSVVSILSDNVLSSGFVYQQNDDDIYILTTVHGLKTELVTVYFDNGISCEAELLGSDPFGDVAVLCAHLPFKVSPLKIGAASFLKAGEFAICIATPTSLDYANSPLLALVSSNGRTIENKITYDGHSVVYYEDVIQLSAHLPAGCSGAPLLNMNGELTGMITMADEDVVFALKIEEIEYIAQSLLAEGSVNKLQLGLKGLFVSTMLNYEKTYYDIPLDQLSGYYVHNLNNNSLAYAWGLRANDLILRINEVEITDFKSLQAILYSGTDSYVFDISRNGELLSIQGNIDD